MQTIKALAISGILGLVAMGTPAQADPMPTQQLNVTALPGKNIWNSDATVTPLAFNADGKPQTVIVKVPAGQQAKAAHATKDGNIRFAIVLSGILYYADGETVDKAKEKAYPAGSVLMISSGVKHWVSTREADLQLLLTATNPAQLTPPVKKQLGSM